MLAGGAALALALLPATAIGRRIAGSITGLAGYAEAVGRGEQIDLPHTGCGRPTRWSVRYARPANGCNRAPRERAELLDRTVTAQEAERRRIARELQDGLGQYLTALRLGLAASEPLCASTRWRSNALPN